MFPPNMPEETQLTNYPQIVDGFCYSGLFGLRPLGNMSWYWECLGNMEDLRLAADSYRPRWYTVPKNFLDFGLDPVNGVNILPGKTSFYEFQVRPGSWLWGLQFAVFNDLLANTKFSVIIRQGSELPFFDRVMTAAGIYSNPAGPIDPLNTLFPAVNPFIEPRLIIAPAQLHVEVSNDEDPINTPTASAQLLMLFAEPK